MNVNRVRHSVFCGRLKARFPGWTVNHTTRPGLGLADPCKSRLFPVLTVHSRPPFPFTFCFLPPVNSGGAVRAVFAPVGFRDEHSPTLRTAFQIPVTVNLRFQRPIQWQDRPAEPLAADGGCNHLRTGASVAIVQRKAVSTVTVAALPAYQAVGPLWSRCPEARSRRTSSTGVFLFRRSFCFQEACPSMNYLKCILF